MSLCLTKENSVSPGSRGSQCPQGNLYPLRDPLCPLDHVYLFRVQVGADRGGLDECGRRTEKRHWVKTKKKGLKGSRKVYVLRYPILNGTHIKQSDQ